jgi:hypothetical protein
MTTPLDERPSADRGEYRRTAFGLALSIDSRISIPGLGQGLKTATAGSPSHVRLDADELNRRWEAITTAPMRARELRFGETLLLSVDFAEPAGYLMWAQDFGSILISPDGIELQCKPDPAVESWANILPFQALPLAATIRGLEVMHASGVVLDGRAVLVAGPPGAGKSSLAAALVRLGGELLSDDAVALQLREGALIAHAGSTVLQLRAAEHERLSAKERACLGRPLSVFADKQRYVQDNMPEPAPLGGMFLLARSDEEPAVEQLAAVDPFELIASTFNLSVRTPARLQRQLDVVSVIASDGLAHRLRVQPGIDADQLAELIRAHLATMSA